MYCNICLIDVVILDESSLILIEFLQIINFENILKCLHLVVNRLIYAIEVIFD